MFPRISCGACWRCELHAAFLTESRTRSRRLGPRAGNPGRTSVHGLNRTGKALPKLSLQRSHRERSSKSIRKRSYPAHVRWGEHGAPVQGLRSCVVGVGSHTARQGWVIKSCPLSAVGAVPVSSQHIFEIAGHSFCRAYGVQGARFDNPALPGCVRTYSNHTRP
jgi:hypothetical protein